MASFRARTMFSLPQYTVLTTAPQIRPCFCRSSDTKLRAWQISATFRREETSRSVSSKPVTLMTTSIPSVIGT